MTRRGPDRVGPPHTPTALGAWLLLLALLLAAGLLLALATLGRLLLGGGGGGLVALSGGRHRGIVLVLDDRLGPPGLAQQVAGPRNADRLLVALDLLVELIDALLAILRRQAGQRVQQRHVDREALLVDRGQRLQRAQQQGHALGGVAREADGEGGLLGARPLRVVQLLAVAGEVIAALLRHQQVVQRHAERALGVLLLVGQGLE